MALKFRGTPGEFRALIASSGATGAWEDGDGDCHRLRTRDCAVLNWWPATGTISFQGNPTASQKLESQVAGVLGADARSNTGEPAEGARTAQFRTHIFVVHGHDSDARDQLELALRRLGLEPFILMNATGGGKTIIEALENKIGRDFTSDFGIALFTPDDVGYAKADGADRAEPRARQNVVLETGMLLASLTRERMAIIVKGHVELPSDLQGIIELRFNDHVREVVARLATRMKEAGVQIDASKIAEATA